MGRLGGRGGKTRTWKQSVKAITTKITPMILAFFHKLVFIDRDDSDYHLMRDRSSPTEQSSKIEDPESSPRLGKEKAPASKKGIRKREK